MMWAVASIPLWIGGLFALVVGVGGIFGALDAAGMKQSVSFLKQAYMALALSAILLALAAKVAS